MWTEESTEAKLYPPEAHCQVMKPHIAALIAILGIALAAGLPAGPRKAISQGEFSVTYARFLHLDPRKAWTPQSAIESMEGLGIEPLNGWQPDKPLTEGVLVSLIRPAKMPVLTPEPDRTVTPVEARAVLHRIERLYRSSFIPNRTPGGPALTGVETSGGNVRPSGGGGRN